MCVGVGTEGTELWKGGDTRRGGARVVQEAAPEGGRQRDLAEVETLVAHNKDPLYPEHQQPPPVSPRAEIVRPRGPLSHPLPDTVREVRGVGAPSPLRVSSPDG